MTRAVAIEPGRNLSETQSRNHAATQCFVSSFGSKD